MTEEKFSAMVFFTLIGTVLIYSAIMICFLVDCYKDPIAMLNLAKFNMAMGLLGLLPSRLVTSFNVKLRKKSQVQEWEDRRIVILSFLDLVFTGMLSANVGWAVIFTGLVTKF